MTENIHYIGIGVPLINNLTVPATNCPAVIGSRVVVSLSQREGARVLLEERIHGSFEQMRYPKAVLARTLVGEDTEIAPYNPDGMPLETLPLRIQKGDKQYAVASDRRAQALAESFVRYMNMRL